MAEARPQAFVTPRAAWLALRLSGDPAVALRVQRGEPLLVIAQPEAGQLEVEYRWHRWRVAVDDVEPWQRATASPEIVQPAPDHQATEEANQLVLLRHAALVERPATQRSPFPWRWAAVAMVLLAGGAVILALLLVLSQRSAAPSLSHDEQPPASDQGTPPAGVAAPPRASAPPASATPASAGAPSPRSTPPLPAVSTLVVCDGTIDCGESQPGRSRTEVVACLRVTASDRDQPLVLVVTSREEPPPRADSPSVVGRSGPISPSAVLTCQPVRRTAGEFASGTYWLWVLAGDVSVANARFQVGPER